MNWGHMVEGHAQRAYGISYEEAVRLNDGLPLSDKSGKVSKFLQQKQGAQKRGIPWEFTLQQWVHLWNQSGKWAQRGARKGCYCMARAGDVGPYSVGNVRIALVTDNHRESTAARNASRGRGYSLMHKSKSKPFTVRVRRRLVGHFATPGEALHARDAALAAMSQLNEQQV